MPTLTLGMSLLLMTLGVGRAAPPTLRRQNEVLSADAQGDADANAAGWRRLASHQGEVDGGSAKVPPTGSYADCFACASAFVASSLHEQSISPDEILIVQFDNRNTSDVTGPVNHNKAYAKRHGYQYVLGTTRQLSDEWHPAWEKCTFMLDAMDRFAGARFAVWIDSDAIFFSGARLEPLLAASGMLETDGERASTYHAWHGLPPRHTPARGTGFLLAGGDSPMYDGVFLETMFAGAHRDWLTPPSLQSGAFALATKDPRSRALLLSMMAHAADNVTTPLCGGESGPCDFRTAWPVEYAVMNRLLQEDDDLRAGTRLVPGCMLAGADCSTWALAEVNLTGTAPFSLHCMGGFDSKDNMALVLEMAAARARVL